MKYSKLTLRNIIQELGKWLSGSSACCATLGLDIVQIPVINAKICTWQNILVFPALRGGTKRTPGTDCPANLASSWTPASVRNYQKTTKKGGRARAEFSDSILDSKSWVLGSLPALENISGEQWKDSPCQIGLRIYTHRYSYGHTCTCAYT